MMFPPQELHLFEQCADMRHLQIKGVFGTGVAAWSQGCALDTGRDAGMEDRTS